jgi:predicted phosphoribosyltransferase
LASGGAVYVDDDSVQILGVTAEQIARAIEVERLELERRERLYRGNRPFPALRDRVVILVDDGLATGATMRVAVHALRAQEPRAVIVAAPVGSREACAALSGVADRTVCVTEPEPFYGVGLWYEDFSETSDAEVLSLLSAER